MNHDVLKAVIFDQQDVIKAETIVPRRYTLDSNGNYAVTGLRRAGKSTLLHAVVRDLVASGVAWERIIYVNFEDERLAEFTSKVESLVRLAAVQPDMRRFVIVTKQEQQTIEAGGVTIEAVPAWRFLLRDPALRAGV